MTCRIFSEHGKCPHNMVKVFLDMVTIFKNMVKVYMDVVTLFLDMIKVFKDMVNVPTIK
jgi:hypothetical protein